MKDKISEALMFVVWVCLAVTIVIFFWMLIAISNPVCAEGTLQLHTASKHSDGCDTCNERNYGLGYVGADTGLTYTVGYYRNSHFDDSWYAGTTYHINDTFKVTASVVTGYEEGPLPLMFVSYRMLRGSTSPVLSLAPTKDGAVMLLSIDFKIGER